MNDSNLSLLIIYCYTLTTIMKHFSWILALLSGLLLCLSWWSWGHAAFMLVAFVPLFFLLERFVKTTPKKAAGPSARFAYLAFFVWNTGVTWWIWNSTSIGAVLAILINSLLMSWVIWVYVFINQKIRTHFNHVWLLPVFWIAFELLHQNWDLSWPWLQLGNVFAPYPQWVQWYQYTGVSGGSLWIWTVNILLYVALHKIIYHKAYRWALIKALVLLIAPISYSYYIYQTYQETGETIEVAVVQPNMDPWSEQFSDDDLEVVRRMQALADSVVNEHTLLLVAPESALPHTFELPQSQIHDHFESNNKVAKALQTYLKNQPQLQMIVGASTYTRLPHATSTSREVLPGVQIDNYNTALLMDSLGIANFYHKTKLVPGVELIPFAGVMGPLQALLFDLGGTSISLGHSSEPVIFDISQEVKAAPLICYESIYGNYVSGFVRKGANLFTVITNDGWWGDTPGYRQHFNLGRLRCVEMRRDMARAANTGVSGFINQRGDVISESKYWVQTAQKAKLHLNNKITFYAKYGDYIGRIAILVSILLLLVAISRYLKGKQSF